MGDVLASLLPITMPTKIHGQREESDKGRKPRQGASNNKKRSAGIEIKLQDTGASRIQEKRGVAKNKSPESGRFMKEEQVNLGNIQNFDEWSFPGLSDVSFIGNKD